MPLTTEQQIHHRIVANLTTTGEIAPFRNEIDLNAKHGILDVLRVHA